MEVDKIGEIKGTPVYLDRNALKADGIIVVGRVKPHTDFKGEIDLVTNADRASEDAILRTISAQFPDHSVLTEEGQMKETSSPING
jgi:fructose-1,6-bisphosphatase/inositol monophosphatase family enzyme